MSTQQEPNGSEPAAGAASAKLLREAARMGRDAFGRSQIFGNPVQHGDVVVIPLGRMRGGAGGGGGASPTEPRNAADPDTAPAAQPGSGAGTGWGIAAKATGAIVINGDRVRYVPAVDVTAVVVASIAGLVATAVMTPRIIRAARR